MTVYTPDQIDHFLDQLEPLEVDEIIKHGRDLRGRKVDLEAIVLEYVKERGSMQSYAQIVKLAESNGCSVSVPRVYKPL